MHCSSSCSLVCNLHCHLADWAGHLQVLDVLLAAGLTLQSPSLANLLRIGRMSDTSFEVLQQVIQAAKTSEARLCPAIVEHMMTRFVRTLDVSGSWSAYVPLEAVMQQRHNEKMGASEWAWKLHRPGLEPLELVLKEKSGGLQLQFVCPICSSAVAMQAVEAQLAYVSSCSVQYNVASHASEVYHYHMVITVSAAAFT